MFPIAKDVVCAKVVKNWGSGLGLVELTIGFRVKLELGLGTGDK